MKKIIVCMTLLTSLYVLGQQPTRAEEIRKKRQAIKKGSIPEQLIKDAEAGSLTAQLFLASAEGDYKKAETLLKNEAVSPDIRDPKGNTPLHYAKNLTMIKLLKQYGANLNVQNNDGIARIHMDVVTGRYLIIDYLLNHGASVTATTRNGVTPLHLATMISYFSDPTTATGVAASTILGALATVMGADALGMASKIGEVRASEAALIAAGKASAPSGETMSALARAAAEASMLEEAATPIPGQTASEAFEAAAAAEAAAKLAGEEAATKGISSAAQEEAIKRSEDAVKAVDSAGLTAAGGVAAVVAGIISAATTIDIAVRNDIARRLIISGANPNAQDIDGNTPLHTLASGRVLSPGRRHGGVVMAKLLILKGAKRDIRNKLEQTPYLVAKQNKRLLLMPVLNPSRKFRPVEKLIERVKSRRKA